VILSSLEKRKRSEEAVCIIFFATIGHVVGQAQVSSLQRRLRIHDSQVGASLHKRLDARLFLFATPFWKQGKALPKRLSIDYHTATTLGIESHVDILGAAKCLRTILTNLLN
jgi:hypothetical protein